MALNQEKASSTACEDSSEEFDVSGLRKYVKAITCNRAAKRPTRLCQFPEVFLNCPDTCSTCNGKVCEDARTKFFAPDSYKPNKRKTCKWAQKKTEQRCKSANVSKMCPATCDTCKEEYSIFVSKADLQAAVDDYCADPEGWSEDPKYATYGPIESWNVYLIEDMSQLFYYKTNCNPDISELDVSNVKGFAYTFAHATSFNTDLSNWDVSSVTDFTYMLYDTTSFNTDLSNWDVSSGEYFSYMFDGATSFNQDLCPWKATLDAAQFLTDFCGNGAQCKYPDC
jgi:surface protein